jgi:hypothetical protein
MPALNFQPQFVPFVEDESKLHSIRAKRKRPWKVGDNIYLYTGLRHKGARLIRQAICVKVERITMQWARPVVPGAKAGTAVRRLIVVVDGEELSPDECESLARRDGFEDWPSFVTYWFSRIPFHGEIIHWSRSAAPGGKC